MSKISLKPNSAGTANFEIAAPATNTDRTFTLPDEAGTIITSASVPTGNAPSFSARRSTDQTAIASSVETIIVFNTVDLDTDGGFDTSTGRYTVPTGKAGKYFLSGGFRTNSSGSMTRCSVTLYVNNVPKKQYNNNQVSGGEASSFVAGVVDLSTGDFVDIRIFQNSGSSVSAQGPGFKTYFYGFRLSE